MEKAPDATTTEPDEAPGAPSDERASGSRPPVDYEPTGIEAVDRVLAEVAGIADRPVGEHVEVFERAHEQLRRALDARPDARPGPGADDGQGA
ncbi:hypothetical protein Q9S36_30050 [Microbacterium sp. ARD31]|uniref:hypothetical protein n=1 Tax=Microbacterium sp. ARD31 TaxID=2962576 RepID=UPI00288229EE|nr:hypothetical protein [Microbacterium sp. ARD31]MDT0184441.1 hypothetical protein [Microbacterium sp. ARD31]